jgi:pyridoxamine 5'-phosphate oxidase
MPVFGSINPTELFASWLKDAEKKEINDPWAMSLATVDSKSQPSVRIVLLRGFDERGFAFFTNYDSAKAEDMKINQKGAICFHWKSLTRQVRAEGVIEKVSAAESDAYFASRARDSQIGAWASAQSKPLTSREYLLKQAAEFAEKFKGRDVPRPPNWGGYRLAPTMIEFWQQGDHRLHDREVFYKTKDGWKAERLNP